ncbi:MmgE/PrpD family protein [Achromobacter denitrificans]|uniref:MmgE/PrpD family protein n=1 Tax=Achromobacter denitrificans TaxID=32002 RepID=UPI000F681CED|nr:MmgE/PrpD family protein [Achromobacter denitrificans]MDX3877167.1 MmgE/PrpD family protein [Achromobacter sp.]MBV2160045.1 MmgE/PrpD family protein [Achromobacter denitrificans]MPT40924.1 MmgE/PrpD family protein [Achromobacter sp.]RSE87605.1 MmgE/PrpD family protein [Achromobacter denitrificans]WFC68655.1 MmgE/PrpD family protein [Achromobacter denitrificans]
MTGLTQALAAYVAHPELGPRRAQAESIARQGMTDTIAVALAARDEAVTRIALDYARGQAGPAEGGAPLWFGGEALPPARAAFVNGVASHALDYDDVALSGHPSAALTAAILAQGHAQGASGRDCLLAYIVGYEVWAELASREPDPYHIKGWHPTAVFGTVAATAALARLRGFEAPVAARALAIGASLASGLVANFGTMTKPLHAGRVAAQAFEAVTLAGLGLTAADDALEHHAGFLAALSPRGQVDRERPYRPGEPRILATGLSIKKYPVCYSGHRIIDAVIDIAREADLDAAQVARVRVGIGRAQASMLRNAAPVTALEAKFSAQFAVAAALLRRKVGLSELDDAFVNEPAMRALYGKVEIGIVEAPDPEDSAFSRYDTVDIDMRDGRVLRSGEVRYPRGHAHLPLAEADLRAKFEDCMAVWRRQAGGDASSLPSAGALYDRLASLAQIDDVRTLFRG